MSKPYDLPFFGSVQVEDRLVEYDGLRLFTVRSDTGARLLAFLADEEPEELTYWYFPISDRRYRALLEGVVDLRTSIEKPENRFVLETVWDYTGGEYTRAEFKSPGHLNQELFPHGDYQLNLGKDANPLNIVASSQFVALQIKRLVARLAFDFGRNDHEAPIGALGGIVTALQETMDALGQALKGQPTERGPIADEITSETALSFRAIFESSFGIELASEKVTDLFGDSLATKSFMTLMDLLECGDDTARLKELFSKLRGRSAKRYRSLIQSLAEAQADVVFDAGRPATDGSRHLVLKRDSIPAIVTALYAADPQKPSLEHFDAELIGYNKRTKSFEILHLEKNKRYTGKVTGKAVEVALEAQVSHLYHVHIAVTREYEPLIDNEATKYELYELHHLRAKQTDAESAV